MNTNFITQFYAAKLFFPVYTRFAKSQGRPILIFIQCVELAMDKVIEGYGVVKGRI